ncbi:hypothetical protein LEMLEM_LOCUS19652 [Lemmus lemmus]
MRNKACVVDSLFLMNCKSRLRIQGPRPKPVGTSQAIFDCQAVATRGTRRKMKQKSVRVRSDGEHQENKAL